MNLKGDQANRWLQERMQQIEHIDTTLLQNQTYLKVKTTVTNSYQALQKANFLNSSERTKVYFNTIHNYVVFASGTTQTSATSPVLQEINNMFQLNIRGLDSSNLSKQCEQRCKKNDPIWKDSFFCQICSDTPIAQFIERIKILPTHQQPYFFQTIMYQIVFALGKKWYKPQICTEEKCMVCNEACDDVEHYIVDSKQITTEAYVSYASGFRIIHLIEKQLTSKNAIKNLVKKAIPESIKRPLQLLVDLVNKAELNKALEWNDINALIELLDSLPVFVFSYVSTKYLEPQGIQLIQTKKPNETLLQWLNAL